MPGKDTAADVSWPDQEVRQIAGGPVKVPFWRTSDGYRFRNEAKAKAHQDRVDARKKSKKRR